MVQTDKRNTHQLFKAWHSGDAEAGQLMAQRFADWFYAIATSRLGEVGGAAPCERACARFGDGVVSVKDARDLVKWAHKIVAEEIEKEGGRATDGDEPNAYTNQKTPKVLLLRAKQDLPQEVGLLEAVYGKKASAETIEQLAEPLGGNPMGVLKARYQVKRWLRDKAGVKFDVAPESPILDRAPLPLYESATMAKASDESNFEQWMLSDIDLCKDIAEFATFSIALRGGLAGVVLPRGQKASKNRTASEEGESGGSAVAVGGLPLVAGGIGLFVLVAAVAAYFVFL